MSPLVRVLARVDELELLGLLGVDLVLELEVLVGLVPLLLAGVAEVAGGGVAGPGEGLRGEVGAAPHAVGPAEGRVGQVVEAGRGGVRRLRLVRRRGSPVFSDASKGRELSIRERGERLQVGQKCVREQRCRC